jgi:hypothetical protein
MQRPSTDWWPAQFSGSNSPPDRLSALEEPFWNETNQSQPPPTAPVDSMHSRHMDRPNYSARKPKGSTSQEVVRQTLEERLVAVPFLRSDIRSGPTTTRIPSVDCLVETDLASALRATSAHRRGLIVCASSERSGGTGNARYTCRRHSPPLPTGLLALAALAIGQ